MQAVDIECAWNPQGHSLRVSNDLSPATEGAPFGGQLFKTKQIDLFQNEQNIIKNRVIKKKCKNSCKKQISKFRNENFSSGKKKSKVLKQNYSR
jgi:hypothetical protein